MGTFDTSIIVTIYNVEKYISECIHSILNQTYKEFELILVNNASTDNSMAIATEFVEKALPATRYQFINNQKNMGCVYSRNTGLKAARGEYILYVDSDDVISPNFIEDMVNTIKKGHFDSCICETVKFPENTEPQFENRQLGYHEQKYNNISDILRISGFPTAIVYRKSIIEQFDLEFEESPYMEDAIFNTSFLIHVNRMGYVESAKYFMRQRKGSLSRSGIKERNAINNLICACIFDKKYMNEKYYDCIDQIIYARRYVRNCFYGELKENGYNKYKEYREKALLSLEPIQNKQIRRAISKSKLSTVDKIKELLMSVPLVERLIYKIML